MIDPKTLDEIEARANAATQGPWKTEDSWDRGDFGDRRAYKAVGPLESCDGCAISNKADGDFVAHARDDVPALIAEVRRLRAESERAFREGAAAAFHEAQLMVLASPAAPHSLGIYFARRSARVRDAIDGASVTPLPPTA